MTTVMPSQPVAPAQPEQQADSPVQPSANSGGPDPLPNNPNADITITCTKGSESKQVTGKSPVQCPAGYQMKPMAPGQPGMPSQPLDPFQPGIPMQPAKQ